MAEHAPFEGVGVALVTLFDEEGEIDAPATADHAARLVDAGLDAIVVAGTTGEAVTLDPEERSDLLIAVRSAADGRVPVIVGTGAPSARQAVVLSRRAAADGADALLVLSPAGVPDPRPYYERVASSVDIPVLAYHYPKASSPGVHVDVLRQLPGGRHQGQQRRRRASPARSRRDLHGPLHRCRHAHPPRRRHRLLGRHPGPCQRGPGGLPARRGRATAPSSASSSAATAATPSPASRASSAPSAPSTAPVP